MERDIKLLGALSIRDDGENAPLLSNAKGCALLAYLIVHGETKTRERVADLLWEASTTTQGLRNLRVMLTRVRTLLPDVAITRKTMAFAPLADEQVDYLQLRDALEEKNKKTLLNSLKLYRGDLLAGFYLDDAPHFQTWLLARERLRRQVLDAHRWLCETLAADEDWEQGVKTAVHWLTVDELDEEAIRWLMQFLAVGGQTAAALTHYEQFKRRLQAEIGLNPEPKTEKLAETIRNAHSHTTPTPIANTIAAAALDWPQGDELAPVGLLPTATLLPFRRNPDFVGREAVLLQLADLLLPWPDRAATVVPPVVGISGMGGLGKTQTAVEFCYRYGRFFPGGVFWFSFADAANIAESVAAIGGERGLGLFQEGERLTLAERVGRVQRAWQEAAPRLLVFDNCEEVEQLLKWLPVTGGCRVLVTSRRSIWPRPLQITAVSLGLLAATDSVALLRKSLPSLHQNEALQIAAEVGHLPLALHLAGSFLKRYNQLSPLAYLKQLRQKNLLQHPSLQGHGTSYSPTGHELNVARTYAINLQQLNQSDPIDEMAWRLLIHAACFAPDELIPRQLLLDTTVAAKQDVVAKLTAEDGLMRLIALGFLEAKGRQAVAMHRLLVAFTTKALAEAFSAAQATVENQIIDVLTVQWQLDNYLVSLPLAPAHVQFITDAAIQRADANAARLASLWGRHLMDLSDYQRAHHYLQKALTIREAIFNLNHAETADSLNRLGSLYWATSEFQQALPLFEKALAINERLFGLDDPQTARTLNNLGVLTQQMGSYKMAQTYFERVLAIGQRLYGHKELVTADSLNNLGFTLYELGDYETARQLGEKALVIRQKMLGQHPKTAISLNNVGNALRELQQYKSAHSYYRQALAMRHELFGETHRNIVPSLHSMGILLSRMGHDKEARPYFEKALAILESVLGSEHLSTSESLHYIGMFLAKVGEIEQAKIYLERALAVRKNLLGMDNPKTAVSLLGLGEWYLATGNMETAQNYFQQARRVLETAVLPTHIDWVRLQKDLAN